jgi:N utilization substance protein A
MALTPAFVSSVTLDAHKQAARVVVPTDSMNEAIGRGGVNAWLANRLTGWRLTMVADYAPRNTVDDS